MNHERSPARSGYARGRVSKGTFEFESAPRGADSNREFIEGMITKIQSFCPHDGPGVRTTVFLKGCPLTCWWCHNPENLSPSSVIQFFASSCIGCGACGDLYPELPGASPARFAGETGYENCAEVCYPKALVQSGRPVAVYKLMELLRRELPLYRYSGGGVTFSGGEPMLQPDFLAAALAACRDEGIHTAVETCAYAPYEVIAAILPVTDLVICDVKCINPALHMTGTGVDNRLILENIRAMDGAGANLIFRVPVIPGWNDSAAEMEAIAGFLSGLREHPVELLPFHGMCAGKYESLGMDYRAKGLAGPSPERIAELSQIFQRRKRP